MEALELGKAESKQEAVDMIESREYKVVELDYMRGGTDLLEVGRLGRKYLVGVRFPPQITVLVKNELALQRNLQEVSSYHQRHLYLAFAVHPDAFNDYQKMALEHSNVLFYSSESNPLFFEVWE